MWASTTSLVGSSGGGSTRATAASVVRQTSVSTSTLRNEKGNGGMVGASHGVEKPGVENVLDGERVEPAVAEVLAHAASLRDRRHCAPTALSRPDAAERYIASRTSTARCPTRPGAPFSVLRPRQRSTSTRSGSSQA